MHVDRQQLFWKKYNGLQFAMAAACMPNTARVCAAEPMKIKIPSRSARCLPNLASQSLELIFTPRHLRDGGNQPPRVQICKSVAVVPRNGYAGQPIDASAT